METLEHRNTIRSNFQAGREEGLRLLEKVTGIEDLHALELEAARRMVQSADAGYGYPYNHDQGFFHTVSDTPLSLLKRELALETTNV